jgi:error-prone DNA polymerase
VARADVEALVAARDQAGPYRSIRDLAARAGAGRSSLEQLAWSGACDVLIALDRSAQRGAGGDRRLALWQIGVTSPGHAVAGGTQLALPLDPPAPPRLRELGRWQGLVADYATTGVTVGDHVMAALRPRLQTSRPVSSQGRSRAPLLATSAQLARLPHGCSVAIAGLVIARQRPATANGIVFLLFEDEWGTVNLIVPPAVYERQRSLVRAEPLLLAHGRLERPPAGGGVINVIVSELAALDASLDQASAPPHAQAGDVRALPGTGPAAIPEDPAIVEPAGGAAAAMRAFAPAVQSFAAGRRR